MSIHPLSRTLVFLGLGTVACATDARNPGVTDDEVPPDISAAEGDAEAPGSGQGGGGSSEVGIEPDVALEMPTGGAAGGASSPCRDGETRDCGKADGICEFGTQTCEDSAWEDCSGGIQPGPRDCTSPLDNDCDGQADNLIDETCQCVPGEVDDGCGSRPELHGKGICAPGTRTCSASADGASSSFGECVGEVGPAAEVDRCDTRNDDNCDGTENGDCPCVPGESRDCGPGTDEGVCQGGSVSCVDGVSGQCDAVFPGARNCGDSQDNDCNGVVDIDEIDFCTCVIGESRACNEHPGLDGRGRCEAGSQTCVGRLGDTRSEFGACAGGVGPLPTDSCAVSGDDSNCDGQTNGGCACVIGVTSSCPNPDPANCAVACVRSGSDFATRCTVSALDRDRDGASSCAAAGPAPLDCDDGNANVRPGAVEVCNGIDDDCDGLIDSSDGLAVGGVTLELAGRPSADVAFAASEGNFRFVAERGETGGIAFGIVSGGNAFPIASLDPASEQVPNEVPRIVAFGDEFGVVHTRASRGGPPAFLATFSRVAADGAVLGTTRLGASGGYDGGLAVRPNGVWVSALGRNVFDPDQRELLELGQVNAMTTYTAAANRPEENMGAPRVAVIGDSSAAVWQRGDTFNSFSPPADAIRWVRFNNNLVIQGAVQQLDATGAHPDIASVSAGYFIAWAVSAGIRYQINDTSGAVVCSGASEFGNGLLDSLDAVAVEDTPLGIVVLATDFGSGDVGVLVYDEACRERQSGLIPAAAGSPSPRQPTNPNIAEGGESILFAWTEGQIDSQFRLTSALICN